MFAFAPGDAIEDFAQPLVMHERHPGAEALRRRIEADSGAELAFYDVAARLAA